MIAPTYAQEYLDKYYRFDDGDGRKYWRADLCAAGTRNGESGKPWHGIDPRSKGMHWKYTISKLDELDAEGRIYWPAKGTMPQYKRYIDELKGKALSDIWDDIDRINPVGTERLGYPTQKPLALLERIIEASSNPGDVMLDPFCGCGTAVHAAQKLERRWIGIDITHLAIALIEKRLKDAFPYLNSNVGRDSAATNSSGTNLDAVGSPERERGVSIRDDANNPAASSEKAGYAADVANPPYAKVAEAMPEYLRRFEVIGTPEDVDGARDLALRDKYQFQWWACSLVNAQPYQGKKKGADGGIDGLIFFQDDKGAAKKIVVSVKGGDNVNVAMVRDLAHVVKREKAEIGLFVTLADPSKPMEVEAVKEGFHASPATGAQFPRIQILTIAGLLDGNERARYPDLAQGGHTFKKARRDSGKKLEQEGLF